MAVSVNQQPTEDDWRELMALVDKEIPSFHAKMNERTNLRLKEYQICILVRLHFKPYEMVNLTDITIANVSNIRKRLLWKVFGLNGGTQEFDRKIQQIYR